jgi:hypothetical protein
MSSPEERDPQAPAEERSEAGRATTERPTPTTPPGNPETDEESVEKGREQLDKVTGG